MKSITWAAILLLTMAISAQAQKPNKKKDYLITISTEFGDMELILFDETPRHKENFVKLVNNKYYNGTTFHRIIDNFMIQGGDPYSKDDDPNNDGIGGPGYTLPAEFSAGYKHVFGSLAAARQGDNINPKKESSGSQFYIVENRNGTPFLDGQYTVFGQVVKGLEVIEKIAVQPKGPSDRPLKNISMTLKAELLKKKKITERTGYQYPAAEKKKADK
jgi:cyclophilin family peptidyl-prolyl cis-trans isomerase